MERSDAVEWTLPIPLLPPPLNRPLSTASVQALQTSAVVLFRVRNKPPMTNFENARTNWLTRPNGRRGEKARVADENIPRFVF